MELSKPPDSHETPLGHSPNNGAPALIPSGQDAARSWRPSLQGGLPRGTLRFGGRFVLRTMSCAALAPP